MGGGGGGGAGGGKMTNEWVYIILCFKFRRALDVFLEIS